MSRRTVEKLFEAACLACVVLPLLLLAVLLLDVLVDGAGRLSLGFLTSFPSRHADQAGVLPAIVGSTALVMLTAAIALPVGVGAALYLEEYGKRTRLARVIEVNIANLAGVPSVVYGLLGLELFVRTIGLGRSLLAGALTLSLLVLPIIIMSSREALRVVPLGVREAGAALGATRWQVLRMLVLPVALPGILTGAILAVSRALGETAPLIVVGALAYVTFLPDNLASPYTALPIQIFNWVSRPGDDFAANAAAGILVMMVLLLGLNAVAILLRDRLQRRLG